MDRPLTMIRRKSLTLNLTKLVAGAVALGACAGEDPRPGVDEIVLDERVGPCEIVFIDTGTVLSAKPRGVFVPNPSTVTRGLEGRYFTGSTTSGIHLWSRDGEPLGSIGARGEGPGEFDADGLLVPKVAPDGTLHVFTTSGQWVRFDRSLDFVGDLRSPFLLASPSLFQMMPSGHVLSGQAVPTSANQFHVLAPDGSVRSAFGDLPPPEERRSLHPMALVRSVAVTDSDTFWAAPALGAPEGYRLEEWSSQGELLRVIQRRPDWFPAPSPHEPPEPIPPHITVQVIGNGLLLSIVTLERPAGEAPGEAWIEVIDPEEPGVLASRRAIWRSGPSELVFSFFPGTPYGWRRRTDSLGLHSIEVARVELRSPGGDEGRCSRLG